MLKAALQFSDAITTVSPSYAQEIRTEAFGAGLHGVLQAQSHKLTGILNGIDTEVWNPQADTHIERRYGELDPWGKHADKIALQERCGLAIARNFTRLLAMSGSAADTVKNIV